MPSSSLSPLLPSYVLPPQGAQAELVRTVLEDNLNACVRLLEPTNPTAKPGEIALFFLEQPFVTHERGGCSHTRDRCLCNGVSSGDFTRYGITSLPKWSLGARGYVALHSFADTELPFATNRLKDALREMNRFWTRHFRRQNQTCASQERTTRRNARVTTSSA